MPALCALRSPVQKAEATAESIALPLLRARMSLKGRRKSRRLERIKYSAYIKFTVNTASLLSSSVDTSEELGLAILRYEMDEIVKGCMTINNVEFVTMTTFFNISNVNWIV